MELRRHFASGNLLDNRVLQVECLLGKWTKLLIGILVFIFLECEKFRDNLILKVLNSDLDQRIITLIILFILGHYVNWWVRNLDQQICNLLKCICTRLLWSFIVIINFLEVILDPLNEFHSLDNIRLVFVVNGALQIVISLFTSGLLLLFLLNFLFHFDSIVSSICF